MRYTEQKTMGILITLMKKKYTEDCINTFSSIVPSYKASIAGGTLIKDHTIQ